MALAGFGSGHLAKLSYLFEPMDFCVTGEMGGAWFNPCPPFIPAGSSMWLHNEPDYGLSIPFSQPQISSLICIIP